MRWLMVVFVILSCTSCGESRTREQIAADAVCNRVREQFEGIGDGELEFEDIFTYSTDDKLYNVSGKIKGVPTTFDAKVRLDYLDNATIESLEYSDNKQEN